jgi:multidrug efflux pump subunit AcrA (membrane-fusion protein)
MRVEADIPNPDALLFPGVYGEVRFGLGKRQASMMIPTSAMIFGPEGTQVAKIGADNKISFQKIVVGRDLGQEIEVTSGLTLDDRIVANPGERLGNGMEVQVAEKKTVDKRDSPAPTPVAATAAGGTPAATDAAKTMPNTEAGR